jgi:hypothetical protein
LSWMMMMTRVSLILSGKVPIPNLGWARGLQDKLSPSVYWKLLSF